MPTSKSHWNRCIPTKTYTMWFEQEGYKQLGSFVRRLLAVCESQLRGSDRHFLTSNSFQFFTELSKTHLVEADHGVYRVLKPRNHISALNITENRRWVSHPSSQYKISYHGWEEEARILCKGPSGTRRPRQEPFGGIKHQECVVNASFHF